MFMQPLTYDMFNLRWQAATANWDSNILPFNQLLVADLISYVQKLKEVVPDRTNE
jgi:hypothetical protein